MIGNSKRHRARTGPRGSLVRRSGVAAVVLALAAAACGGSGSGKAGSPSGATKACDPHAIATAAKPVDITFWYGFASQFVPLVNQIIKSYNDSQSKVHVNYVNQVDTTTVLQKFRSGQTTGDLPDVAVVGDSDLRALVDSRAIVPVGACVKAAAYDTSDFLPRALSYYTVNGTLQTMPWGPSNPVLYYSAATFQKAGLDPDKPPTTLAQVKEYAQKIVATHAAKYGMALPIRGYFIEFWMEQANEPFVNNNGGRSAPATKVLLDTPVGRQLFSWWDDMVRSGLALNTGGDPSSIDHLLAVGNGQAAMTIEASSAVGPIEAVIKNGEYPGVVARAAPLPSLVTNPKGLSVGDSSLFLSAKSSPLKTAAAWDFITYLVSTKPLVALDTATGYIPIRKSELEAPALVDLWKKDPNYRVGYDQLVRPGGAASDGSAIGAYQDVRQAVIDAITSMLTGSTTPEQAVKSAAKNADAKMAAYNERLGG